MQSQTTPSQTPQFLLNYRQAARVLGISERTLFDLKEAGEIPTVKLKRAVRFDPRDLDAWIQRKKS